MIISILKHTITFILNDPKILLGSNLAGKEEKHIEPLRRSITQIDPKHKAMQKGEANVHFE